MALNSPYKDGENDGKVETANEKDKIDGLIRISGERDEKKKMCYEDDDKEQNKKKCKNNNKEKEEVKSKESPNKNDNKTSTEKEMMKEKKNDDEEKREHFPCVNVNDEDYYDDNNVFVESSDACSGNLNEEKEIRHVENVKKRNEKDEMKTGQKHFYTQKQIDSFTVRVLAIEKTLENSENRVEQLSKTNITTTTTTTTGATTTIDKDHLTHQRQYLTSEVTRARSPSMPNTLMLGVPKDGDDRESSFDDTSSCGSSRYGLGPLLEVKRPHCTLNCEYCKVVLEERFKHSK